MRRLRSIFYFSFFCRVDGVFGLSSYFHLNRGNSDG